MSDNILKFGDYFGSSEFSLEDECLYGKILFIEDTITYEAETVSELKFAFEAAVTDYVQVCSDVGKDPQKPFKGSFNVRIPKDMHRAAAIQAKQKGMSLNDLVKRAINNFIGSENIENHIHQHYYMAGSEAFDFNFTSSIDIPNAITQEKPWKPAKLTVHH